MKAFRDSNNQEWTVFEVRRQVSTSDGVFLPTGYSDGWLCFETSTEKRRLVKYPPQWKQCSERELEKLLGLAAPAPRVTWRRGDDLSDSSILPDIRPD